MSYPVEWKIVYFPKWEDYYIYCPFEHVLAEKNPYCGNCKYQDINRDFLVPKHIWLQYKLLCGK